ncbi:hypothetical protein pb186bvf_000368 [Paramecium bursaria]
MEHSIFPYAIVNKLNFVRLYQGLRENYFNLWQLLNLNQILLQITCQFYVFKQKGILFVPQIQIKKFLMKDSQKKETITTSPDVPQVPQPEPMVPYSWLYRYATPQDKQMMALGAFGAFCNGAAFPSFSIIFGNMTDSFASSGDDLVYTAGMNSMQEIVNKFYSYFLIVGLGTFLMSFLMFSTWMITGERQGIEFRKHYFRAILKQEIGWFDTINPNELNSKVANETFAIQGAIGEKMPTFIMTFSMTFFGFLIGYIQQRNLKYFSGWQLALVVTATLPALSIFTGIFAVIIQTSEIATQKAYSDAGAFAEQAINAIKTVKMLDGEDHEHVNYSRCLVKAAQTSIKYNFGIGLSFGLVFGAMIWSYALGFWYGAKLISEKTHNDNSGNMYTVGDVLIIFFAILTGGFSLGQAGPCVQYFAKGRAAAVKVFAILDRQPKILNPANPRSLGKFNGEILIKNVTFRYPNKQDLVILDNITLRIPSGKKVALVGESGCGKSTIMQLVERFYDTESGEILFGGENGINVKDVSLLDLRSRIGMVGQEPVLFATSIRENLRYGKTDATEDEMIEALKKVNAWDFVSKMDKQLETYVGIGGSQLSGGQKQRIAIARAILKKPQVLLLDEATSALDRTNEKLIQSTLDEVSQGITTIVIAHRLRTIQNADIIYVIDKGQVVEKGTHQELINLHGKYESLALSQIKNQEEDVGQEELDQSPNEPIPEAAKHEQGSQFKPNMLENKNIVITAKEEINKFKQIEAHKVIKGHLTQDNNRNKVAQDEEAQLNKSKQPPDAQMGRLFEYNKDERCYFVIGMIAALCNGCVFPIFSLFLARIIAVLVQLGSSTASDSQFADAQDEANRIGLYFFFIGLASVILWGIQNFFLTIVGEQLTLKLRQATYRKLLRMPISYFDLPKNNAGTLTSRLSVDCKLIQGLTSTILGINLQNIGSMICGLVIAFEASWALTLIMLALSPLAFLGGVLQAQFLQGFSDLTDEAYKDSGNLIMEAVTNIRTVVSFGNEDIILNIYGEKVQLPLQKAAKRGVYAGLAFGFSQMQMFLINALIFYIGALLVAYHGLPVESMFKSILAITFATMGAGNNQAFAGDIGAAKNASKNIFELLDTEDEFQREERLGRKKLKTQIQGNISVNNITFKYESREKNVFENLSLQIAAGKKVAFVGPSGCGKSTIMQMLMRFYDPDEGEITLDGVNIADYDIRYLRRQLAIVSQEPVLFQGTIKENIQYNLPNITIEQIHHAAKQANAYDFIMKGEFEEKAQNLNQNLGSGFDRQVGPKGSQISGGQKQRVAIARAILRQSNILLLDEATSALDSASEKLVQDSLNTIMSSKTTLAIAHRISTIQDSDTIYVFHEGKIVEQGAYNYLVGLKGYFYRMEQGIAH